MNFSVQIVNLVKALKAKHETVISNQYGAAIIKNNRKKLYFALYRRLISPRSTAGSWIFRISSLKLKTVRIQIEMVRQKEQSDRRLLKMEIVIAAVSAALPAE